MGLSIKETGTIKSYPYVVFAKGVLFVLLVFDMVEKGYYSSVLLCISRVHSKRNSIDSSCHLLCLQAHSASSRLQWFLFSEEILESKITAEQNLRWCVKDVALMYFIFCCHLWAARCLEPCHWESAGSSLVCTPWRETHFCVFGAVFFRTNPWHNSKSLWSSAKSNCSIGLFSLLCLDYVHFAILTTGCYTEPNTMLKQTKGAIILR